MAKKVKLSKAQHRVVEHMRKYKCPIYGDRSFVGGARFSGFAGDAWDEKYKRRPSSSTLYALVRKGVLERRDAPDKPWYRRDFYLASGEKPHCLLGALGRKSDYKKLKA